MAEDETDVMRMKDSKESGKSMEVKLNRLNRNELLQLLLERTRENESLRQEIAELKEKLEKAEKRQIDPVFRVDPTLIGGLIVEIDGKVYDGSVRSRLRDVKDVMIG